MKNKNHYLFMYLLGTILPTLFLYVHFGLGNIILLIVNLVISYLIFSHSKLSKIFIVYLIIFICGSIYFKEDMINTCFYIYNEIIEVYNEILNISTVTVNVSETILIRNYIYMNIFFQIIISYIYKLLKDFKLGLFFITILLIFPSLIVLISLNWIVMTLFIIYCFNLLIPVTKQIQTFEMNVYFKQILLIVILSSISVNSVLYFLPENKVANIYKEYNDTENIGDNFNDVLKEITKYQLNQNSINLNDAKNRYYTDVVHLNVKASTKDTYYLKYFSASEYIDNTWKMLDLEKYESVDEKIFETAFESIISYLVSSKTTVTLSISDERKGNVYSIYPYFIRFSDMNYKDIYEYDAYVNYDNKTATFEIWNIDQITNSKKNDDYREFVYENYLEVSNNIRNIFVEEFNLSENIEYEEAKKVILDILKNYQYTLKPGSSPVDQDFVEYFLLESKKGYCVHYASVATLMFRFMGIPARYVEGYLVKRAQFDKMDDENNWLAEVLDSDAHAWVEIYDDEFGWIPVEVTVGTNIDNEDEGIENNQTTITPIVPGEDSSEKNPSLNQNENLQIDPELNEETKEEFEFYEEIFLCLFVCIIILSLNIKKLLLEKSYIQKDNKKAIYSLVKYYEKLSKYQIIDNEKIIELFEKNKFSKNGCNREELYYIKTTLKEEANKIYKNINIIKKIKYKIIDLL